MSEHFRKQIKKEHFPV